MQPEKLIGSNLFQFIVFFNSFLSESSEDGEVSLTSQKINSDDSQRSGKKRRHDSKESATSSSKTRKSHSDHLAKTSDKSSQRSGSTADGKSSDQQILQKLFKLKSPNRDKSSVKQKSKTPDRDIKKSHRDSKSSLSNTKTSESHYIKSSKDSKKSEGHTKKSDSRTERTNSHSGKSSKHNKSSSIHNKKSTTDSGSQTTKSNHKVLKPTDSSSKLTNTSFEQCLEKSNHPSTKSSTKVKGHSSSSKQRDSQPGDFSKVRTLSTTKKLLVDETTQTADLQETSCRESIPEVPISAVEPQVQDKSDLIHTLIQVKLEIKPDLSTEKHSSSVATTLPAKPSGLKNK